MKNSLWLTLLLSISFSLIAQYFSKSYTNGLHAPQFSKALLTSDSSYAVFGGIRSAVLVEGLLIKLNRYGDTLFTSKYVSDQNIIIENAVEYDQDSSFFLTGYTIDTSFFNGTNKTFISRMDKYGNILWQKNYRIHDSITTFSDFKIVDDTLFLTANNYWGNGYLLKLDLLGNVIAQVKFPWTVISNMLVRSDHSIVFTGNKFGLGTSGIVFKVDPSGNVLWSYSDNMVGDGGFGKVQELSNGILLVECRVANVMGQSSISYLHKFDSLGSHITTISFDIASTNFWFTDFHKHSDDAMTIMGSHYYSGSTVNFKIEFDSSFQIIHYKTEPGDSGSYCLLEIDENRELMCGGGNIFMYDPIYDNCHFSDTISTSYIGPWVIPDFLPAHITIETPDVTVTSSNWTIERGLTITDDCLSLEVQQEKEPSFSIFPNPASDKISILNESAISISTINIIDMKGITRKNLSDLNSLKLIDVSIFTKGIYIMVVNFENGTTRTRRFLIQ